MRQGIKMTPEKFFCDDNLDRFVATIQALLGAAKVAVVCVHPPGEACIRPDQGPKIGCRRSKRAAQNVDIEFSIESTEITAEDVGSRKSTTYQHRKAQMNLAGSLVKAVQQTGIEDALQKTSIPVGETGGASLTELPCSIAGCKVAEYISGIGGGIPVTSNRRRRDGEVVIDGVDVGSLATIIATQSQMDDTLSQEDAVVINGTDALPEPTDSVMGKPTVVRVNVPCDPVTLDEATFVQGFEPLLVAGMSVGVQRDSDIYFATNMNTTVGCHAEYHDVTITLGTTDAAGLAKLRILLHQLIKDGYFQIPLAGSDSKTDCDFYTYDAEDYDLAGCQTEIGKWTDARGFDCQLYEGAGWCTDQRGLGPGFCQEHCLTKRTGSPNAFQWDSITSAQYQNGKGVGPLDACAGCGANHDESKLAKHRVLNTYAANCVDYTAADGGAWRDAGKWHCMQCMSALDCTLRCCFMRAKNKLVLCRLPHTVCGMLSRRRVHVRSVPPRRLLLDQRHVRRVGSERAVERRGHGPAVGQSVVGYRPHRCHNEDGRDRCVLHLRRGPSVDYHLHLYYVHYYHDYHHVVVVVHHVVRDRLQRAP